MSCGTVCEPGSIGLSQEQAKRNTVACNWRLSARRGVDPGRAAQSGTAAGRSQLCEDSEVLLLTPADADTGQAKALISSLCE